MTKAEKAHKAALANLGCALCAKLGYGKTPPQLHHLRAGGWGKGDYKTLMPLCPEHHIGKTGIHGMGTKAFERHYKVTQQELLQWALVQLEVDK
jgi:hypothetical protein